MVEPAADGNDEEGMLACVKNFDSEQAKLIKTFVESELKQPVTLQGKFFELRPQVSASRKHFQDIGDLPSQMQYLLGILQEKNIFPKAWVTYASSTSYLFKKTGHFVESTGPVFGTEGALGIFVSIRSKYILLSLKDMIMMKVLQTNSIVTKAVMDMCSAIENSDPEKDDELSAALAAFDSDPCTFQLQVQVQSVFGFYPSVNCHDNVSNL